MGRKSSGSVKGRESGLSDHDIEKDYYLHFVAQTGKGLMGTLKRGFHRFVAIRGTPREIALGLALGVFVGMTPFMGVHTATAVLLAVVFGWSKLSAAVGVQISNVATAPFVYWFTYQVGKSFHTAKVPFRLPSEFSFAGLMDMLSQTPEMIWILTIGGFLVGLPLAFVTYWVTYNSVTKYRAEFKEKLAEHKRKLLRKARRKK